MKNILLKIIVMISIIGIAAFIGIAIFLNIGIEYEAFEGIVSIKQNTDFETLYSKADSIKTEYKGQPDIYSRLVNKNIRFLNEAIDYYIDYLACFENIYRGEQDTLLTEYKAYISKIEESVVAMKYYENSYTSIGENETPEQNKIAANVAANCSGFVYSYEEAFHNGCKFLETLVKTVEKYLFEGNEVRWNYEEVSYQIFVGLGNNSHDFILAEMKEKEEGEETETLIDLYNNNDGVYKLVKFHQNKNISSSEELTDFEFAKFLKDVNNFNIFELFGKNSQQYILSLEDEGLQQLATSCYKYVLVNLCEMEG